MFKKIARPGRFLLLPICEVPRIASPRPPSRPVSLSLSPSARAMSCARAVDGVRFIDAPKSESFFHTCARASLFRRDAALFEERESIVRAGGIRLSRTLRGIRSARSRDYKILPRRDREFASVSQYLDKSLITTVINLLHNGLLEAFID